MAWEKANSGSATIEHIKTFIMEKFNNETYNKILKKLEDSNFGEYDIAEIFEDYFEEEDVADIFDFDNTPIKYFIKAIEDNENNNIIFANAVYVLGDIIDNSKYIPPDMELDEYDDSVAQLFLLISPAIDYLIKALENKDENVRNQTAYTLELMAESNVSGIEKAFDFFVKALEDKSRFVRLNLASAVGHTADNIPESNKNYAVNPLIKLLDDKDETVREYTVEALGKIGNEKAVEPLLKMMTTKDDIIYDAVVTALENIYEKTKSKIIYETVTKMKLPELNKFKEVLEDNLEDIWDEKKTELYKYIDELTERKAC